VLHLIPLNPRPIGYDPIKEKNLTLEHVKRLATSGEKCWKSILNTDVKGLGEAMKESLLAWKELLPLTVPDWVMKEMETKYFPYYPGAITSGSGGGYVVIASEKEVKDAIKIKVRY
jgi:hypothetical protein